MKKLGNIDIPKGKLTIPLELVQASSAVKITVTANGIVIQDTDIECRMCGAILVDEEKMCSRCRDRISRRWSNEQSKGNSANNISL